jgi:hypothetical protein
VFGGSRLSNTQADSSLAKGASLNDANKKGNALDAIHFPILA